MDEHLVSKIINSCVVKLSNSRAITRVPRLDLDYFESQSESPRLNQRLPVVIEAKMFSKLSPGVTNAKYFNQAARNVACMAEIANRAGIDPASFEDIAF